MATTYTKLRSGDWGIRSTETLAAGMTVQVTKKSGESKTETVDHVIWTGNGVTLASIARSAAPASPRGSYRRRGDGGPRGFKPCYMCGSYYCEGARGGLCEDD
jgi:hypothetical protein